MTDPDLPLDPLLKMPVDVRFVQPFQASKDYLCPACRKDIPAGTGHVVSVPLEAPDLRRHWHRRCWERSSTHVPRR